jgi:hypothetical protein
MHEGANQDPFRGEFVPQTESPFRAHISDIHKNLLCYLSSDMESLAPFPEVAGLHEQLHPPLIVTPSAAGQHDRKSESVLLDSGRREHRPFHGFYPVQESATKRY